MPSCNVAAPLITLPDSVRHWPGGLFVGVLVKELVEQTTHLAVQQVLQQGLRQGSYVGPSPIQVGVLNSAAHGEVIEVKVGVFYTGIIAGCSCADDPTPVDELSEYCELLLRIDRQTTIAKIELLED